MTRARIIADYAGTGASTDLATQAELDASYVPQGEPHIIPGVLYPAMRKFKKIAQATGTAIGNMTDNGGIASAFNGQTYASYTNSARNDPSEDSFIGKDWGSGNSYKITRFKVWASHNYALAGTTASRYMKLQGSNDNSSWTDLYEDPDIIGNYQIIDVSAGITTTTAYRYHRLFFEGDDNGGAVAELEFYTEENPGRVYLADKETAHSGAYGTEQSDGKKYYYTEIQGSKPIKDPRIGAHFGSQRHKTTSVQLLEEETAAHGLNVYSIDGREWLRAYGSVVPFNNAHGTAIYIHDSTVVGLGHLEIVGYFSDITLQALAGAEPCDYRYKIDGGSLSAVQSTFVTSSNSPLGGRHVSRGSSAKVVSGQTLGIHTLTLMTDSGNDYLSLNAVELIAQEKFTDATCDYNNDQTITHDANTRIVAGLTVTGTGIPANATVASVTSSTEFELSAATTGGAVTNGTLTFGTNNIQIPSQDVVSYGKKFTVSDNPHYDPFNGFTNGTTTFGTKVDTATSLGLGEGTTWGAPWAISSSNHIRPFNGGRVVKWVDSSGTIKTSVTMMPRNAQAANTTASNEITPASATNSHTINFSDDAIESSLAEKAKSFYLREFGNGSDNGNADFADASTVSGADDIGYVMDDGLTSLSCKTGRSVLGSDILINADGNSMFITFIGTGISLGNADSQTHATTDDSRFYIDGVQVYNRTASTNITYTTDELIKAQNLPYGTHILQWKRVNSNSATQRPNRITIFQPKKPAIPEDAVVIADYMLMADFVANTTSQADLRGYISKGVRFNSASRDHLCDMPGGAEPDVGGVSPNSSAFGGLLTRGKDLTSVSGPAITYFGETKALTRFYHTSDSAREFDLFFNGTAATSGTNSTGSGSFSSGIISGIDDGTGRQDQWINTALSSGTLGTNTYHIKADDTDADDWFYVAGTEIITPTHTSSHYQEFETPYLKELVGGDRNMEQTNLVVTPDGKTWDEVTRDTSYLGGNLCVVTEWDTGSDDSSTFHIMTEWRGVHATGPKRFYMNKDFAIAYDRVICLVSGEYSVMGNAYENDSGAIVNIWVNGVENQAQTTSDASESSHNTTSIRLERGDYVQLRGRSLHFGEYNRFIITRL